MPTEESKHPPLHTLSFSWRPTPVFDLEFGVHSPEHNEKGQFGLKKNKKINLPIPAKKSLLSSLTSKVLKYISNSGLQMI